MSFFGFLKNERVQQQPQTDIEKKKAFARGEILQHPYQEANQRSIGEAAGLSKSEIAELIQRSIVLKMNLNQQAVRNQGDASRLHTENVKETLNNPLHKQYTRE